MYEWTFGINGSVIFGRRWEEFDELLSRISELYETTVDHRLVVFVHNLAFEFQFMRERLEWDTVFSVDDRKPVKALTKSGIEFRCSLLLSGYSLADLGDRLRTYKVAKMVGDLDYSKIRTWRTPLTPEEWKYCGNDVRVVMSYIQETLDDLKLITRIPMTKTGYVRKLCKKNCLRGDLNSARKFSTQINAMRLDADSYIQLKRGFQGGFTHANAFYTDNVIRDVRSYDFTSSYPAVMISEKFPCSSPEIVKIKSRKDFEKNLKLYCCIFDIEFFDIEETFVWENYISKSRCWDLLNVVENNGRIASAAHMITTVTGEDFEIIRKTYRWESMRIANFRRFRKDYLPKPYIETILDLYGKKTSLKDVEGFELDYSKSKEYLNALYGMTVTDICRPEIAYSNRDGWKPPKKLSRQDIEEKIESYNKKVGRFLYYAWGVWVTAYARRNLWSAILTIGKDYIYSDTDSVKIRNAGNYSKYFDWYNAHISEKVARCLTERGFDPALSAPKTIKGASKPIGVWDDEGLYSRFKTLGAKRYLTEKIQNGTGKIKITVAGVGKKNAVEYLHFKYGDRIFENFTDELRIPAEYTDENGETKSGTGKLTHTYIDEEIGGIVTDYLGEPGDFHEFSSVHLSGADYSLKLSDAYADFILRIQEEVLS